MAKKKRINKSQAIRDYVSAHSHASAKQVVAALAKKRIKVTAATVATVKSKAGLTKNGRRKKSPTKTTKVKRTKRTSTSQLVDILIEAKKFRARAGSTEAALQAIDAIDRIDAT